MTETLKILFVDDEPNILRSLKRCLVDEPFEVLTAQSAAEGLELLDKEEGVGIVVSDQRMPGMTGVEFLQQVKEQHPNLVRLLLTGYADVNAAMDAVNKAGAGRYVTKPWDDRELVMILQEQGRRFRLEEENRRLQETIRQKNEELKDWNARLKSRVLEQTAAIGKKNEELSRLNRRLRLNYDHAILAFANLLELSDESMLCHGRNVSELSVELARQSGVDEAMTETIRVAALLHDIGKIGSKGQAHAMHLQDMGPEEVAAYERHPVRGQAAIDFVEDLRDAGVLIRHHHERYDGQGFPDGLSGVEIPLGARIIALADGLEAAVRRHPGIDPMMSALRCAEEGQGSFFDPALTLLVQEPVRKLWGGGDARKGWVKLDFHPMDLRTGMVLVGDLRSGTGLLLLKKGTALTPERIASIHRFHELDPGLISITVLVEEHD